MKRAQQRRDCTAHQRGESRLPLHGVILDSDWAEGAQTGSLGSSRGGGHIGVYLRQNDDSRTT